MCLKVKRIRHLNGKAKVARRNIPCFKVLWINPTGQLVTPFRETPMTENVLRHKMCADFLSASTNFVGEIFHGIHSYKNTTRAFEAVVFSGEVVVRAYIPKGTKYWIGKYGEYASEVIKFH